MKTKCILLLLVALGILSLSARAQNIAYSNYCTTGATPAKIGGATSSNRLQASYPRCTVTVFLAGTTTPATLFSGSGGGTLGNPFTATTSGLFTFYAVAGTYDVTMSGGDFGGFPAPVTIPFVTLGGSGGGGGGGGTPAAPVNSIQLANPALNGFQSDTNFLINPSTHTFSSSPTGNMLISALSSLPRAIYDPMDTSHSGGLAAAIAGTSGFTPTQVIQATMDYGECEQLMGHTIYKGMRIPIPSGVQMGISQLLLWNATDIGGTSGIAYPGFQHNDMTKPMITVHAPGDTITCSNSVTYNPIPGGVSGVYIHDLAIAGGGQPATHNDIGIKLNAYSSVARNIQGYGNGFGAMAVTSWGSTTSFLQQMGFPGGQLKGCGTYTSGTLPVSGALGGICAAVVDGSLDGGMDNIYATDGQAFASGHAVGPCYPGCAAIAVTGNGTYDNNLFGQVSSIGVIFNGTSIKANTIRVDYTSREAIRFSSFGGGDQISGIAVDSSCTDTALLANWNSGVATGCSVVTNTSAGNVLSGISVKNNAGIFANSYNQCWFNDPATGFNGVSNTYALFGTFQGSPNNTGPNSWLACGAFGSDQLAGRILFPDQSAMQATGATANATGVTSLVLNGQTLNTVIGGIGGQHLFITGPGTLHHGGSSGTNDLSNQNGLDNALVGGQTVEYVNTNTLGNNHWQMISGLPSQTPTHVNFAGNPTVASPSLLHVIGNAQATQATAKDFDFTNLHGAIVGGQACFSMQSIWPDGSYAMSPLHCTNINLAAQTPGEIFTSYPPSASDLRLWLVSNAQGNGVPIGRYPPPAGGFLYDGPTTIAAGGDGTTAPPASETNTGEFWAPFGVLLNTSTTQPVCSVTFRGLTWVVRGAGGVADTFQVCQKDASNNYAWFTPSGGGGGGGTVTGSGTINTVALWTTTSAIGNSHLTESGGLDIFTQPVQVNDGSGMGGGTKATEGTRPTGAFAPAAGSDTWWASTADHWPLFNPNGTANDYIFVGMSKANTYTAGDCVQIDATLHALVDSGGPCGTGGGGAGYFAATAAAPAAPSQTVLQQVASIGRIQAYSANNTTVGSFSIVLTTADGTSIQSFPMQCTVTNCTFNIPTVYTATLRPQTTATVVNCSTSGTVTFAQPFAGTVYRMGTAHLAACVGTAAYTYPNGYLFAPFVSGTAAAVTAVSSATATVLSINAGSSTTGFLKFEEQQ